MTHPVKLGLVCALGLGLCAYLRADTVVMKTGQTLDGKVLSEDDRAIELEVQYGIVRVPRSRILRIEEDTPEKIAEREAKAEEDRLKEEEGLVRSKKGEWVTEEEKKAEDAKADKAKKEKAQKRAEAKKKADAEAKQKADQAKKDAQQLQQQQQQNQQNQNLMNPRDRWMDQRQRFRDSNLDPNSTYGNGSNRRGSSGAYNQSGGYSGGLYNPLGNMYGGQRY